METPRFTMFVPHGAPTFALNPGAIGRAMSDAAAQFAAPRAVVIVSPHWLTRAPTVGCAAQLDTIHDFQGFDPRLYTLRYPAIGCPETARDVVAVLQAAGLETGTDERRGLDHGAWIPLRQMFPLADVPVIPLSVQPHLGPEHAWRVGRALAPLVARGFLVIGSGNVTHNLGDWTRVATMHAAVPDYVQRFPDWVAARLDARDLPALLDYRRTNADGTRAHPTDEHLLPLFTALGAAGDDARAERYVRATSDHVICMDGYIFG